MKCLVCNCGRVAEKRNYCQAHYTQLRLNGKIKHIRVDPNRYFIFGGIVKVELYDKAHDPLEEMVIIDKKDFNLIQNLRLTLNETKTSKRIKVFFRDGSTKNKPLARLIMDAKDGYIVDHINENIFDNRRSNLRVCSKSENNANRKGTSGVWFHKKNKNWCAEIQFNGVKKRLGSFKTKELAREARIKAEKEVFGNFAPVRM